MNQIVSYDEEWAKRAQAYAEQEKLSGGTFLSTRSGVLSFGDEELPGNQACVIVLDAVLENTYYGAKFDPNEAAAPVCYAFGRGDTAVDDMGPHPSMQQYPEQFVPQSATCLGCPQNEFGTADTGRGKACQNRRRLALIPAGFYKPRKGSRDFDLELFEDEKHFQTADIAFVKLPPTSVKNWSKYVQTVSATMHRPPFGVITRLFLEPHPKHQYHVHFEPVEQVPDTLAHTIMARADEAQRVIVTGYRPPEERQAPSGSLRGLRR